MPRQKSPPSGLAAPAAGAKSKPAPSPAQQALRKLGLVRDIDLALHLPLRYEDETRITPIRALRDGAVAQIEATVTACEVQLRPRRLLKVVVDDGTGTCELTFFSFYPSHQKTLAVGARLRLRGEVRGGFWGRQMLHPAFRKAEGELPQALTPVYPTVAQLPQAYLRRAVVSGLQRADLSETLPAGVAPPCFWGQNGLQRPWELREALLFLHHPTPDVALATLEDQSHPAWQRLKAEELLAQQLSQLTAKRERDHLRAPVLRPAPAQDAPGLALHEQLLAALPFALTAAQRRVCGEIAHDMARSRPMHRLLQGDVGAGKTVVAALAAVIAIDAGWQCALMAPTEILAEQHFGKLVGWLEPLLAPRGLRVAWLAGAQKKKERAAMLALVASGEAALVVGTHAVIQEQVQFARLGLAVIDEQHRFGVHQRLALRDKGREGERVPHQLVLTATPIPRTLAMTAYADLDVSVIDELPPGRTPVTTVVVANGRRAEVIARIRAACLQGHQAYWVCTLIEETELLQAQAAEVTHVELSAALPELKVGLVHGRLKPKEKTALMDAFKAGEIAVLVATTVIEVGVDVPNASLMIIENAERLGLAQLHQLRGRVGRGHVASNCVLLYQPPLSQLARARLEVMRETNDGFRIAEKDLELRGPGEMLGTRQTGRLEFRIADIRRDAALLPDVQRIGEALLGSHAGLADRIVARWIGASARYAGA